MIRGDCDRLVREFADREYRLARNLAAVRQQLHLTLEQLHEADPDFGDPAALGVFDVDFATNFDFATNLDYATGFSRAYAAVQPFASTFSVDRWAGAGTPLNFDVWTENQAAANYRWAVTQNLDADGSTGFTVYSRSGSLLWPPLSEECVDQMDGAQLQAITALIDFGRPKTTQLLVLVDRGWRELPIHADYVGTTLETTHEQTVKVHVAEEDGRDEVVLSG